MATEQDDFLRWLKEQLQESIRTLSQSDEGQTRAIIELEKDLQALKREVDNRSIHLQRSDWLMEQHKNMEAEIKRLQDCVNTINLKLAETKKPEVVERTSTGLSDKEAIRWVVIGICFIAVLLVFGEGAAEFVKSLRTGD